MKGNKLLLFFLTTILASCATKDPTASYIGIYTIADYKITRTENGVTSKSSLSNVAMEVAKGSVDNRIWIDFTKDPNGKLVDFEIVSGKYFYTKKYTIYECEFQETIEGGFEGKTINFKQTVTRNCNGIIIGVIHEGQGSK